MPPSKSREIRREGRLLPSWHMIAAMNRRGEKTDAIRTAVGSTLQIRWLAACLLAATGLGVLILSAFPGSVSHLMGNGEFGVGWGWVVAAVHWMAAVGLVANGFSHPRRIWAIVLAWSAVGVLIWSVIGLPLYTTAPSTAADYVARLLLPAYLLVAGLIAVVLARTR